MKIIFFSLLCFFGLMACESKGQQATGEAAVAADAAPVYADLDQAAFKAKIGGPNVLLLDVRTPGETANGKIEGAVELDFQGDNFAAELGKLDKDKTYLVYCAAGGRSGKACKMMQEQGFKETYNLLGGYNAWSKQ